jgi:segregation and condensation protein B
MHDKVALLEAMLFTTSSPLSLEELAKNLKTEEKIVEEMLKQLIKKYNHEGSGIHLSSAGGYKLNVKPNYLDKVSHLTPHADMSRGLLRVLSLIVYHEPIKQSDIVKVIGNRTYEYVKELESRNLIRSWKKSRTKLLETTKHFEEYFSITKDELKQLVKGQKLTENS